MSEEALLSREPSLVSWGQGSVDFAFNRRKLKDAVDYDMPLIKVEDLSGNLKALFLSYTCHAVTLGPEMNQFHGDWVGDAQTEIEVRHPGTIAMIAVGCAGDSNPKPGGEFTKSGTTPIDKMERSKKYGEMIANEAERLLKTGLVVLTKLPDVNFARIELPFAHTPSVKELSEQAKNITVKGYYAKLALERIARGERLPKYVPYPVQTWSFGKKLSIIFLGGEVVADYSIRLKKELGAMKTWVVGYSNDVPCYIGSKRVIHAGGYEGEASMYYYNKPGSLAESVEEQIIATVHRLLKK